MLFYMFVLSVTAACQVILKSCHLVIDRIRHEKVLIVFGNHLLELMISDVVVIFIVVILWYVNFLNYF